MTDTSNRRPPTGQSLPILDILGEAWRLLLNQPGAWFRAMIVPLAIELTVTIAFLSLYGPQLAAMALGSPGQVEGATLVRMLGMQLCLLIAYVLFAVSWHRFALLGPGEAPRPLPSVQGRHVRFLLTTVGLSLLIGLLVAIPLFVVAALNIRSVLVLVGVAILFVVLFVRWQLVFPAIAIERPLSFGAAWQATRGNGLRLFWIFLLAVLPPAVVSYGLGEVFANAQGMFVMSGQLTLQAALGYLLSGLLGYAMIALLVAVVSGAYRRLVP